MNDSTEVKYTDAGIIGNKQVTNDSTEVKYTDAGIIGNQRG